MNLVIVKADSIRIGQPLPFTLRDEGGVMLANKGYVVEGTKIRALLARFPNLTVVTGDRHWQYVSRDKTTGIEEWSVGAATDAHAGGWNEKTPRPEHRFLRTGHGGFFSGEVTPAAAGAGRQRL